MSLLGFELGSPGLQIHAAPTDRASRSSIQTWLYHIVPLLGKSHIWLFQSAITRGAKYCMETIYFIRQRISGRVLWMKAPNVIETNIASDGV